MLGTKALREQRAKLIEDAGQILALAETENRDFTGEEQARWDKTHSDADALRVRIERLERQEDDERALTEALPRQSAPEQPRQEDATSTATQEDRGVALSAWIKGPGRATPQERAAAVRCGLELEQGEVDMRFLHSRAPTWDFVTKKAEFRAQGVGTGSAGGFTVQNEQMQELERALLFFGGMRQASRVIRTGTGATLPWPTVNDTSQVGVILAENTVVANQDVTFGQVSLGAFKYSSKAVLVSVELLQDATVDMAGFVGSALGERLGRITNTHYTVGTGTGQPRGVVIDAPVGKVGLTGQTTTVIFDDLVDLIHSVDLSYRQNSRFMFHDSTLKAIKKLKDTQNRPLFLPGLAEREPDTINGYPYTTNNDIAVMAANAKSILFGDFNKYIIRDVVDLTLLRLNERFADLHQVGFFGFLRTDGRLIDAGTNPIKHYANSAT